MLKMSLIKRLNLTIILSLFIPFTSLISQTRVIETRGQSFYINEVLNKLDLNSSTIYTIDITNELVTIKNTDSSGTSIEKLALKEYDEEYSVMMMGDKKFVMLLRGNALSTVFTVDGKACQNKSVIVRDYIVEDRINIPNENPQRADAEKDRINREAQRKAEQAKIRVEEESKIYNLEEYDKGMYQDVVDELREAVIKHFQTASTERDKTNFPDFRSLRREGNKHARYTSTYDLHYKLHPENKPVNELGYNSLNWHDGFQTLLKKKNVTGDTNYPLYDKARIRIPHVVKSGIKAKTEVYLKNVQVDFARGITEVKVKKGRVEIKENQPDIDLQIYIENKLMYEPSGYYHVEYEISNIMGKRQVFVETELIKKKGKTFKKVAIGSAVVVGAAFYFAGDFIIETLGF